MEQNKYIITAALRFIWPENGRLIFPGSWTYKYTDISEIREKNYYRAEDKRYSFEYIFSEKKKYFTWYVGRALQAVARTLDEYHCIQNTYHYWETVLGTWMCFYIMQLAGAYEQAKLLMKEYKDCQFIVCSKKEIENYEKKETIGSVNKHNGEVVLLTETDKINFELYIVFSKVLWELSELRGDIILQVDNIEYVHEEKINERIPLPNYEKYKEKIKNVLFRNAKVAGYYDHDSTRKVLRGTRGRIRFDIPKCISEYSRVFRYDDNLRNTLSISIDCPDEFEQIISSFVIKSLPVEVMEGYKEIISYARKKLPKPAKVINLQQQSDILTMIMLGEWQKKGTMIARESCSVAEQILVNAEYYEYGMDIFYLWSKNITHKKYRSKPTYKRLCHNAWKADLRTNRDILWCASGFGFIGAIDIRDANIGSICYTQDYMPIFLGQLDDDIKKCVVYRSRDIGGWGYEEFYQDIYPELRLDRQNPKGVVAASWFNFANRCSESRIIVAETILTGIVGEAFWVGTPCVIIDPDVHNRHCALRYPNTDLFKELEECGILYTDPVKASDFINENYDTIDVWWKSQKVQMAVRKFLDKYFYETEDIDSWLINEVNELAVI